MTAQDAYILALKNYSEFKKNKDYYESIIATDFEYSYYYAYYVLEGRFEKGEPVIATNGESSYDYAREIVKGRFELGEKALAKSDSIAYNYAKHTIRGRFELGEYIIFTRKYYIPYYMTYINDKTPIYYKFI